jgi:hypothetical protein
MVSGLPLCLALCVVLSIPGVAQAAQAEVDTSIVQGNLERRQAWLKRRIERLEEDKSRQETRLRTLKDAIDLYPENAVIEAQLAEMLKALKDLQHDDLPFHSKERRARLAELEQLVTDPKTQTVLKWQQLEQALIDALEAGLGVEAWDGDLKDIGPTEGTQGGASRLVTFIRYGRLGLAWQSFDGKDGGWWDRSGHSWQPLPPAMAKAVRQGILIALKRVPPDLMVLPYAGDFKGARP